MISIRVVQPDDLSHLLKVATESYVDTFAPYNTVENMDAYLRDSLTIGQFEKEHAEKGSITYMAWENELPAGFVRLRLSDEARAQLGDNTVELQRLYILPAYKGRKIGSQLMEHTLAYANQNKFAWIWLGVWERNFAAQAFYKSWGFQKFGEHIFQMGDDPQIDWLMKKSLTQ